jgi:5-methyltetrahydropteroyltriglutamate--homocysteine methyltransferase
MRWLNEHEHRHDVSFDGGDLDCGNGLLLLIRRHIDPLDKGQLLEILSTESSVEEDLPAWARMTGNELLSAVRRGPQRSYLICKGSSGGKPVETGRPSAPPVVPATPIPQPTPEPLAPAPVGEIAPLSVMGVGSWPRPRWMLQALEEFLQGRLDPASFHQTADDAVRLAIRDQEEAGVDVVTDGEQRRDNYASFVGTRLENCQLVPIVDLLPYVEDPDKFEKELRALDVPADTVRHPAILGPLKRARPLAVHELHFARSVTSRPVKIALPGPYLLTRTMWLECVSDRVYTERELLARDVVRVLREEIADLLAAGAALVQLDEPVLTEVVFGRPAQSRSFMCGALGERRDTESELAFAGSLLQQVLAGFPRQRLALHVCRGNWSRDESVALQGDYGPLMPLLRTIPAGTFFLEMCTPRAGELRLLRDLPAESRLGLGVVNPKSADVESVDAILRRAEEAIALLGPERVLLNPDCGFATFAASPLSPSALAKGKLSAIVQASRLLREKYHVAG